MGAKDVFIVGAARTAVGSFLGAFADVPAPMLGAVAIKEGLGRAGFAGSDVQDVYMGNVLSAGIGQAPARQASIFAGIPSSVPCTTVNKVCGSGLQSVVLGTRQILLGDADIVVAGGMENMTLAPYYLRQARAGFRMGHQRAEDGMILD